MIMQLRNSDFNLRVFSVNTADVRTLLSVHNSLRPYLSEPANYYPGFNGWYRKIYYQILLSNRAIVTVHRKNKLAGFTILKNSSFENKICTFKINKCYRHLGIATSLMLASLELLKFKSVLITIPDFYHDDFMPLMEKFGFLKIYEKNDAYAKNHSEFFYALNPHLPFCSYKRGESTTEIPLMVQ